MRLLWSQIGSVVESELPEMVTMGSLALLDGATSPERADWVILGSYL